MIEEWKKFFNGGWNYGETPSKLDCFKAGFEAGRADIIKTEEHYLKQLNGYTPETVYGIIKKWQEKFHE